MIERAVEKGKDIKQKTEQKEDDVEEKEAGDTGERREESGRGRESGEASWLIKEVRVK